MAEFVQIVTFIGFKLILLALILVMWLLIPVAVLGFMFTVIDDNKPSTKRNVTVAVIIAAGFLVYVPYAAWIWPGEKRELHQNPSAYIHHTLIQGYGEYSKEEEAEKIASKPIVRTDVKTEIRRYELVAWNPPKHFYVTLEDVATKQVYGQLYVSKHCNAASTLKKGEEYNVVVTWYTLSNNPNVQQLEFKNLYSTFCEG